MKRYSVFIILALYICCQGFAQDDDLYFVPSKSRKAETSAQSFNKKTVKTIEGSSLEYDDWAEGRNNRNWDVDTYNRRGGKGEVSADSVAVEETEEVPVGIYTTRIVRFHSPRIGVYVSSPYYVDCFDYWGASWYASPWYYDWYTPGWYGRWCGYPWYGHWAFGWGWPHYWHSWHHPWYDYAWGSHWHSSSSWYKHGSGRYLDPGHKVSYSRPTRNYAYNNRRSGYVPSRNYGTLPSRNYGNNSNRPSYRRYGDDSSPSRNWGNSSRQPSRNYGNSNTDSRSSRSYSSPSQSNGSNRGGSYSAPSRSFGGGGGRSIGTGGGRGRR